MRLNPVFTRVHITCSHRHESRSCYKVKIVLPHWGVADTQLEEYISTPPISAITMGTCFWKSRLSDWHYPLNESVCSVYKKDGLKVKDLLDARDALAVSQKAPIDEPIDTMIQAGLEIYGVGRDDKFCLEDTRLDSMYFVGSMPRLCKASHRLGSLAFGEAKIKDLALDWDPLNEDDPEVKCWYQAD